MLKSDPSIGNRGFKLTPKTGKAFEELREAFISPLVVKHFNPDRKIKIIIDASKISQKAILLQPGSNSTLTRSQIH
jgi:hypothetical protein